MNILSSFKNIRAFVFDVDGVLTDGSLLVLDDGQMARRMNIKDGYALQLAVKKGYHILVLSGGMSDAVRMRLDKLGVNNIQMNVANKEEKLSEFATSKKLAKDQVLFMGDDMPDLNAMSHAGVSCCPADAVPEIKAMAHYISPLKGGCGCVRDVIEKVLKLNDDWGDDGSTVSK
ncbi:MAG TPA: HAD hydrolase family protein [Ferruginibacter sp.]|nr:HAD hydrolase family protein [Ferruginibacter sp.]